MSSIFGIRELVADAVQWQLNASDRVTRTLEVRLTTGERYKGRVALNSDRFISVRRTTGYREHETFDIPFANLKCIRRYETAE